MPLGEGAKSINIYEKKNQLWLIGGTCWEFTFNHLESDLQLQRLMTNNYWHNFSIDEPCHRGVLWVIVGGIMG